MVVLRRKLKAFSLVEVIVAMVIIMVVFGLAITIATNVFASSGMERKLQARLVLDAYLVETMETGSYTDGTLEVAPFVLTRTVETHQRATNLKTIAFQVADGDGNILLTDKRWVWLP